jgi:hypothetical protein
VNRIYNAKYNEYSNKSITYTHLDITPGSFLQMPSSTSLHLSSHSYHGKGRGGQVTSVGGRLGRTTMADDRPTDGWGAGKRERGGTWGGGGERGGWCRGGVSRGGAATKQWRNLRTMTQKSWWLLTGEGDLADAEEKSVDLRRTGGPIDEPKAPRQIPRWDEHDGTLGFCQRHTDWM